MLHGLFQYNLENKHLKSWNCNVLLKDALTCGLSDIKDLQEAGRHNIWFSQRSAHSTELSTIHHCHDVYLCEYSLQTNSVSYSVKERD